MSKLVLPLVLAFAFPVGVVAQAAQSPCTPLGGPGGQSSVIAHIGVGTPYTLTAIIKSDMVDTKGVKHAGGVSASFQAVDSQGRTRIDSPAGCVLVGGEPRWMGQVTVNDPVANTFTSWQVEPILPRKIVAVRNGAFKEVDPPTAQQGFDMAMQVSQASDHDPDAKIHIQFKVEDLGKRTIAGLEASGMRVTQTFPAGFLKAYFAADLPINSRPYTEVEEVWTSDLYRLILLDIKNNEATGVSSYEVTKFTPGRPDPSLFQPPVDYRTEAH
jgi:hypothetical protein